MISFAIFRVRFQTTIDGTVDNLISVAGHKYLAKSFTTGDLNWKCIGRLKFLSVIEVSMPISCSGSDKVEDTQIR